MKKLALASVMVLALASFAFAQHGWGGHRGMMNNGYYNNGYGPCNGGPCVMMNDDGYGYYGHGYGYNYNQNQAQSSVKNADDAKAKIQDIIKQNYKGYKIGKVDTVQTPRGNMYVVYVVDAGGNPFVFHVNPWGWVRGPMINNQLPNAPVQNR